MPPENSSYKLSSPGGNISQSRWSALMSAPFETVICRISQVAAFIAASLAGLTVAGSLLNLQVLTATFCAEAPLPLLSRTGIFFVALALLLFTCSTEKDKPSRLVQLLALAGILAGCGDPQNTCLQARFCLALVGSG